MYTRSSTPEPSVHSGSEPGRGGLGTTRGGADVALSLRTAPQLSGDDSIIQVSLSLCLHNTHSLTLEIMYNALCAYLPWE